MNTHTPTAGPHTHNPVSTPQHGAKCGNDTVLAEINHAFALVGSPLLVLDVNGGVCGSAQVRSGTMRV